MEPGTLGNLGVNLRQIGKESDPDGFYANAGYFPSDGYTCRERELDVSEVLLRTPLVKHVQNK